MNQNDSPIQSVEKPREKGTPTVSTKLSSGELIEMVYDSKEAKTRFAVWKDGACTIQEDVKARDGEKLIPYSPKNNLIQNGVILFPSEPEEYGSEESLLDEIRTYIRKYVDASPVFEKIASYYVLLSWVYDGFNELPYLRVRGEPGSGKTRFLQTIGALCYKPIFASGASSISPIFRILDATHGTLIIDESDFRMSDEKAEMVKILNNGNVKGFPVLRSELSPVTKEFNPHAYQVFGPKMVATRGYFEDRALESRFLTEEMGVRKLREDIPINLPDTYRAEALHIRNKLLLFRFRNLNLRLPVQELVDRTIEPRLNQIFLPLMSIIQDPIARNDLKELARSYNSQMVNERGMDIEAQVLEIIRDLSGNPETKITVKTITNLFGIRFGQDYDRKITPRYIGFLLRSRLSIKMERTNEGYALPISEEPKIHRLYERYGLAPTPAQRSPSSRSSPALTPKSEHGEHRELQDGEGIPPEPQLPSLPNPPMNLPLEQ